MAFGPGLSLIRRAAPGKTARWTNDRAGTRRDDGASDAIELFKALILSDNAERRLRGVRVFGPGNRAPGRCGI